MKAINLKTTKNIEILGPLLISPTIFEDERGFSLKVGTNYLLIILYRGKPFRTG